MTKNINIALRVGLIGLFILAAVIPTMPFVGQADTADTAGTCGVNLLTNGSFESPIVTHNEQWDIYPSGTSGLGWSAQWVGSGTSHEGDTRPATALVELHRNPRGGFWTAQDGSQYTELDSDWIGPESVMNGEDASVRISQTVATQPGKKYKVTFYTAPRPYEPENEHVNHPNTRLENILQFRWNGVVQAVIDQPNSTANKTVTWTKREYTVTASAAQTEIAFAELGVGDSYGMFLDNVRVETVCDTTPTPPPPTPTPPPPAQTPPPPAGCTTPLNQHEFKTALDQGKVTASALEVDSGVTKAKTTVTNNTDCPVTVSLSAYKMFEAPQVKLSSQEFFDGTNLVTIAPKNSQMLMVNLPPCPAQVDLWHGLHPKALLDSNPYAYPNNPFVIKFITTRHGQPFCSKATPPPPAPNPPPPPTPTPPPPAPNPPPPPACTTELVTNGGFEAPVVSHAAKWNIYQTGTSGLGWNVAWVSTQTSFKAPEDGVTITRPAPQLELQRGVVGSPHGGQQLAELDSDWEGPNANRSGEPAAVSIYQDLPTKAGRNYSIVFYTSPRPGFGPAENKINFSWNGQVKDTVTEDGTGKTNTAWTKHEYTFTATSSLTRIQFSYAGNAESHGGFIDDVSVKEVCEPTPPPPPPGCTHCGGSQKPFLSIEKLVRNVTTNSSFSHNATAKSGDVVEYKVRMWNTNTAEARELKLTDVVHQQNILTNFGSLIVSRNYSGNLTSGGTIHLGLLEKSGQVTATYRYTVSPSAGAGSQVCNTATATAANANTVKDTACVVVSSVHGSNVILNLSKSAFNDTKNQDATKVIASREDFITYTLKVTNTGTAAATNFVITDDLTGVLPLASMVDAGGGTVAGQVITYPAVTVPAGGSVEKKFKVRVLYSLSSNTHYVMKNTYGNTVLVNINNPKTYVAPKTGGKTAGLTGLGFAGLLTAAFALHRNKNLAKLIFS